MPTVVGDIVNYCQIVADKQIGQFELSLQVTHQIENLGLNRYIKGRGWFITNEKFRLTRQRPRNRNPLTLAA